MFKSLFNENQLIGPQKYTFTGSKSSQNASIFHEKNDGGVKFFIGYPYTAGYRGIQEYCCLWKCIRILYPLTDLDPEDAASICISLLDGIDNCLCSWKLKRTCIRRNTWTWNLQYFKKSNPKFLQLYPSKHLFYSNIGKSLVWGGK